MSHKAAAFAIATGLGALIAVTTIAQDSGRQSQFDQGQNPRAQAQPAQPAQPGQLLQGERREALKTVIGLNAPGMANNADSQLAACLIVDNQAEIVLGKLAQEHAKENDVKQFAEQMMKDHGEFMRQLEQFTAATGQGPNARSERQPSADTAPPATVPGSTDRALPGAVTQAIGSQGVNFVALKQQIGQRFTEMVRRDLEQKQGAQFDQCYIGGQIGAHMHVLATLEVLRNQASPELAAVLDKGIETTKTHLDHAKSIAKALNRQPASETAQRESASRNQ